MRLLFDRIYGYILSFFITPPIQKKRRKYTKGRAKTIRKTLDGLDENFRELTRASDSASFFSKGVVRNMKKLGPYIPPNDIWGVDRIPQIDPHKVYPSEMFVATNLGNKHKYKDDEQASPNFLYAQRLKKAPHWVEPTKDTIYLVGLCWPVGEGSKNFWVYYYIAVDTGGNMRRLLWQKERYIPTNNGNSRARGYTQKYWERPDIFEDGEKDRESLHITILALCMDFWNSRNKMWNVIVKKNGVRMTFCIDTRDTKHYFKERELVTTKTGARKKIIHFVEEHNRKTTRGETMVREHIRGERQFNWKGYRCNVKAPRFPGITMDSFTVEGTQLDPCESSKGYINADKLSAILTERLDERQNDVYGIDRHDLN